MHQKTSNPVPENVPDPVSSFPILVQVVERLGEQRNRQANYIDRIASKMLSISGVGDGWITDNSSQAKPPDDLISCLNDLIKKVGYQNDRLLAIANHLDELI